MVVERGTEGISQGHTGGGLSVFMGKEDTERQP